MLALSPAVSAQQPARIGSEFQANVFTSDQPFLEIQRALSLAFEADGNFVVAWTTGGQDGIPS
jgi:hypothetical protein